MPIQTVQVAICDSPSCPVAEAHIEIDETFVDAGPEMPVVAHVCTDCGVVVVNTAVHDRLHDQLDSHYHHLGGSA